MPLRFPPTGAHKPLLLLPDVGVQVPHEAQHHPQDMIRDDVREQPPHVASASPDA